MTIEIDDVIAVTSDSNLWVVDSIEDLGDQRFKYHCSMLGDDVVLAAFVSEEIEEIYLPLHDKNELWLS